MHRTHIIQAKVAFYLHNIAIYLIIWKCKHLGIVFARCKNIGALFGCVDSAFRSSYYETPRAILIKVGIFRRYFIEDWKHFAWTWFDVVVVCFTSATWKYVSFKLKNNGGGSTGLNSCIYYRRVKSGKRMRCSQRTLDSAYEAEKFHC